MTAITELLQARIRQLERTPGARTDETVSSGFPALDRLLPDHGFRRGSLVEWLSATPCGAGVLSLTAASQASHDRGPLIVIDRRGWFCPSPAFALHARDLVVVRPPTKADELWTIDQGLRCPAVGAVLAWPERLDGHTFRRLKLAAETSGVLGCLVRPSSARGDPTWADVRLLVSHQPGWRIAVELLRCPGHQGGRAEIILDETTSHGSRALRLAPELADPTAHRRAARA